MSNEDPKEATDTSNETHAKSFDTGVETPHTEPSVSDISNEELGALIDKGDYDRPPLDVTVVPREAWSKIPRPDQGLQFIHPVQYVMVTHTGTKPCSNTEACIKTCKQLQRHHIALGHSDILYNFLLGGDGKVYEGRGWLWKGGPIPKYPDSFSDCVKIAHIGYYGDRSSKKPEDKQIKLQYDFIETGMNSEYVPFNATIVPDYNE